MQYLQGFDPTHRLSWHQLHALSDTSHNQGSRGLLLDGAPFDHCSLEHSDLCFHALEASLWSIDLHFELLNGEESCRSMDYPNHTS